MVVKKQTINLFHSKTVRSAPIMDFGVRCLICTVFQLTHKFVSAETFFFFKEPYICQQCALVGGFSDFGYNAHMEDMWQVKKSILSWLEVNPVSHKQRAHTRCLQAEKNKWTDTVSGTDREEREMMCRVGLLTSLGVRVLGPVQINSGWNLHVRRPRPQSGAVPPDQIRKGATRPVNPEREEASQPRDGKRWGGAALHPQCMSTSACKGWDLSRTAKVFAAPDLRGRTLLSFWREK